MIRMKRLPSRLSGLKFQFLQSDANSIPNNCPPVFKKGTNEIVNKTVHSYDLERNEYPATGKYKLLGIYPVYKVLRRGFEEPGFENFDYWSFWKDKCTDDGTEVRMTEEELVDSLDKMQKDELGGLETGATSLLGYIGRKAIIDGNAKLAGKVFDELMDFTDYMEKGKYKDVDGTANGKEACSGPRARFCDESLARALWGVGLMTSAAVKNDIGLGSRPASSLLSRSASAADLGKRAGGKAFAKEPYKTGMDTMLRCMIESESGSLKRDKCTEMIKDVLVEGVLADKDQVYTEAADYLGSFFSEPDAEGNVKDLETFVNATVWLGSAFIKTSRIEKDRNTRLKGVDKILEVMKKQKRESPDDFSVADWTTQQALVVTANDGYYNRHDSVIQDISEDRLATWNPWLDVYLSLFPACKENDKKCMGSTNSDVNKALQQLTKSVTKGCLIPFAKKGSRGEGEEVETDLTDADREKITACARAISTIVSKAGDDNTLRTALEPFFMFGQKGRGITYIDDFAKIIEGGINDRFTPTFVRNLDGSDKITTGETAPGTQSIERWHADILRNRLFERKANAAPVVKNYDFVIETKANKKSTTRIIPSDQKYESKPE